MSKNSHQRDRGKHDFLNRLLQTLEQLIISVRFKVLSEKKKKERKKKVFLENFLLRTLDHLKSKCDKDNCKLNCTNIDAKILSHQV